MTIVLQLRRLAVWLQLWPEQGWTDAAFGSQSRLCNRCQRSFLTEVISNFIQLSEMVASGSQTEVDFASSVRLPCTTIGTLRVSAREACPICSLLLWAISSELSNFRYDGLKLDEITPVLLFSSLERIRIMVDAEQPHLGSAHIHVYTSETDPIATHVRLRPNPASWDSKESYQAIGRWIETCRTHIPCQNQRQSVMPTRVLDVGRLEDDKVRLHTSGRSSGEREQYLALSYCWGSSQPMKLTSTNFAEHENGIKMSAIAPTIRDAVVVTRKLGFRYLWVDSLCIIQDCAQDWQLESSKMADVYGGSFLTICAGASADCHDGIFCSIPVSARTTYRVPYDSQTARGELFLGPAYQPTSYSAEPINHRGWTLQEQLLSWRVVNYGKDALGWQCQTESSQTGLLREGLLGKKPQWRPELGVTYDEHDWRRVAEEYSTRQLSDVADKLSALAGIARMFHSSLDAAYLAGMWQNTLLEDLLWIYVGRRPEEWKDWHSSSYVAPSWSWMSANGPVRFLWANAEQLQWRAIISGCNTELSGPDPFGRVTSGTLILHGPIKQACWDTYEDSWGYRHRLTEESSEWPTHLPHYKPDDTPLGLVYADFTTSRKDPFGSTDKVWCLLLQEDHLSGNYRGLILIPVASYYVHQYGVRDAGHRQLYRRIGVFTIIVVSLDTEQSCIHLEGQGRDMETTSLMTACAQRRQCILAVNQLQFMSSFTAIAGWKMEEASRSAGKAARQRQQL